MADSSPPQEQHESVSEAHSMYLKYHRHHQSESAETKSDDHKKVPEFSMFHRVAKTGVIYATSRAQARGFTAEDPEWANMGQGAPETGPIEGAPERSFEMNIADAELEYAPVTGLKELREKVAGYYNHLYRGGKKSQYSYENVCIVPGGRAGISRIMSALGNVQVGYFSPDYTAYEQALGLFLRISPSPLLHRDVNEALMSPEEFEFQAAGRGLGAVLLSNPCNPTGQSIEGENLKEYVRIAREHDTAILMDEFYSHYYYDGPNEEDAKDDEWPKTVSSAAYVEDVNIDPMIIVNGLTKNWRCPGFRVCWVVAPKAIVEMLGSAGSFLDGGANAPLQRLALPLMELDFIRRDTWALQRHFKEKRDFLLRELDQLGIDVQWKPTSTFYVWASLKGLPEPLNDSLVFLEECTKHKVVCVPGVFFDVNPRGIRNLGRSKCISNVRFSYGPPMPNLTKGVEAMDKMIQEWKKKPTRASVYEQRKVETESS